MSDDYRDETNPPGVRITTQEITPDSPLYKTLTEALGKAGIRAGPPTAKINTDPSRAGPILRDHLKHWQRPNPFRPNDLVTPAQNSGLWKPGLGICLVIEVHEQRTLTHDLACVHPYNMRLMALEDNGTPREVLGHSRDFELVERLA